MTGIERLRGFARCMDELSVWPGGMKLLDIAEQIERELRDERDRWESDLYEAQVEWNRVTGVFLEMERHCLYNEDTVVRDVARWARELRHAMKSDASDERDAQNPSCHDPAEMADVSFEVAKVTLDPAEDVSMSAYDLLPEDEREAIAWVRDHGGLDAVKKRTMPEDMSWPFYEDGEPVRLGEHWQQDGYDWSITSIDSIEFAEDGVRFENEYADAFYRYGERVERPEPKVLDADGAEIRAKETVFDKNTGEELIVTGFEDGRVWCEHRMTDADALPVRGMWSPDQLTHERPVADTWERIEEDAEKDPCGYFGFDGEEICGKCPASGKNCEQTMAQDLVRRARALAERERGE